MPCAQTTPTYWGKIGQLGKSSQPNWPKTQLFWIQTESFDWARQKRRDTGRLMTMSRRRKVLAWLSVGLGLLVLGIFCLAPSWRNYYFHRGGVRIIEDQRYVAGSSHPKHQLDLYLPTAGSGQWPVVVFVHGGFWRPMDRRTLQFFTGLHGAVGVAFANRGVATAVISYRQFPDAESIPDALEDVSRAVRYVIDNIGQHGGDPKRIYIMGHSAGGTMTSLLAVHPQYLEQVGIKQDQVRGFVCLAAAYDLADLVTGVESVLADRVRRSVKDDNGLKRFSSLLHVRSDHPPMLIVVGTGESPALLGQHRRMSEALRSAGGDARSVEIPGEDHMDLVMHLSRTEDRALSEVLQFIERHP